MRRNGGLCGGFGIPEGYCDCDGNTVDECGVCGGTAPDSDGDGTPDCLEICPFDVDICASAAYGDFNFDGIVNFPDWWMFAIKWLSHVEGSDQCAYDITSDNESICTAAGGT